MNIILNYCIKILYFFRTCFIHAPLNFIYLRSNAVAYTKYPRIKGHLFIKNQGEIIFLGQTFLRSGIRNNPTGGDTKLILWTGKKGKIEIGSNTGISNSAIVSFCSVSIGDNVLIGGGCKIYDTDFHPVHYKDRIIGNENSQMVKCKPVKICDNVFIGGHSIILKGVTIGKGAVIGAGSVVTKDIPDLELWAGNPAKFIRKIII